MIQNIKQRTIKIKYKYKQCKLKNQKSYQLKLTKN